MPNEPFLIVESVTKRYGDKAALKDFSLSLTRGGFLTIFGPNGAGKSTLLKLLSQQTIPTSGNIFFEQKKISDLKESYRSRLGVISHQPFLYEGLSAFDNLKFYASLYDIPNPTKIAKELLTRVDLAKRMNDPVRTYSRGMLQRASIARALLNDPEIIILDEPYTGLDKQASCVLTGILQEQFEKSKTIILVTHDLGLGYELASDILIIKGGKTAFYGKKELVDTNFDDFYMKTVGDE